ncbi:MAG TPA: hypothetical protein VJP76_08470 [Candidatus Tumulicola sp.]|nr:hypothetical protein [Candidatus Tumulicola sp.]
MDDNLRKGIEDADATGMVAGEELITQAETVLPAMLPRPAVPSDELHAALPPGHEAHAAIDRLHEAVDAEQPDRTAIEAHVRHLRGLPELEAMVANWWESPSTQRFVWNLTQIGL